MFLFEKFKRVYVSCLDYNFRMKINLSRQKIGILLGENITHEKILGENIHINYTDADSCIVAHVGGRNLQ